MQKRLIDTVKLSFSEVKLRQEDHKYCLEKGGETILLQKSVSSLVSDFYEEFDEDFVSQNVARRRGVSQDEVLQEWADIRDESLERGSRVHNFGERYPYNPRLRPSCPQEKAVVKFWQEKPEKYVLVNLEKEMYHYKDLFGGTADIVFYDTETDTFVIADYKTNKDLFKNHRGRSLYAPFSHKLDCPFSHYEIQLSYYQILLEQISDVKVSKRVLIWLKLDENYEVFQTEDLTEAILKERKERSDFEKSRVEVKW